MGFQSDTSYSTRTLALLRLMKERNVSPPMPLELYCHPRPGSHEKLFPLKEPELVEPCRETGQPAAVRPTFRYMPQHAT